MTSIAEVNSEAKTRPTLADYWHPICPVDEVTEQPQRFTLLGEDLVVFRHADGVSVFKDLCIHRGAALSGGWVTDGRITCPYHGWQYDHDGRCVKIPSLPPGQSIPQKARAIAHRATEAYGMVWVALGDPVAPVPPWPDDSFDDPSYRCFIAYRSIWEASAGRAAENFMDFSHFPFVHPGLLGKPEDTVIDPATAEEVVETEYGVRYACTVDEPGELFGGLNRYEYTVYLPFTVHIKRWRIADPTDITTVSLLTRPITEERAELFMYSTRNHATDPSEDVRFSDFAWVAMEQDRVTVESQRPHKIPVDLREELHLRVPDANGIAYRRVLGRIDHVAAFMP
jgi:phenylpropionate dioxygenase-like ring-hydroxylating dioxygenase large terminal subunit